MQNNISAVLYCSVVKQKNLRHPTASLAFKASDDDYSGYTSQHCVPTRESLFIYFFFILVGENYD